MKPWSHPAVDFLGKVDPAIDSVKGPWRREGQGLISPAGLTHALIQIPYIPPEEYDLRIEAERVGGTGSLDIGLCTP